MDLPFETTKHVTTRFDLNYQVNHGRIAEDQRCDGIFPLVTNVLELSELEVLLAYKRQPVIEKRFSQLKTDFRAAPFVEPEQKVPLVFPPGFSRDIRFRRMNQKWIIGSYPSCPGFLLRFSA